MKNTYQQNGCHLLQKVFPPEEVSALTGALSVFDGLMNCYGVRDLMHKVPYIRKLAESSQLLAIAEEILGAGAKPVRAVYFDKLPEANWGVAWHQDTSIAVSVKADVPGFGPWSVKDGIVHVEPPPEYLQNILTLRIHLDSVDSQNGVLRVVPGSHRAGRIKSREILAIVAASEVQECCADAGDVLLMSPLLLHASHKAKNPSHRRIVHLEYSALTLPEPLQWYETQASANPRLGVS